MRDCIINISSNKQPDKIPLLIVLRFLLLFLNTNKVFTQHRPTTTRNIKITQEIEAEREELELVCRKWK